MYVFVKSTRIMEIFRQITTLVKIVDISINKLQPYMITFLTVIHFLLTTYIQLTVNNSTVVSSIKSC